MCYSEFNFVPSVNSSLHLSSCIVLNCRNNCIGMIFSRAKFEYHYGENMNIGWVLDGLIPCYGKTLGHIGWLICTLLAYGLINSTRFSNCPRCMFWMIRLISTFIRNRISKALISTIIISNEIVRIGWTSPHNINILKSNLNILRVYFTHK